MTFVELLKKLEDTNTEIRCEAAILLGKTGDVRVIEPLINAFEQAIDWESDVISESLQTIGNLANPYLLDALTSKSEKIRQDAAFTLMDMKIHEEKDAKKPIVLSNHSEDKVRSLAVRLLAQIQIFQIDTLVIEKLSDSSVDVQKQALNALGILKANNAIQPLLQKLESPLVIEVIHTLKVIGNPVIIEALIPYAKHSGWKIRRDAILAIGQFEDNRIPPILIETLADSDPDVRQAAINCLAKLKPMAFDLLIDATQHPNPKVRSGATSALKLKG